MRRLAELFITGFAFVPLVAAGQVHEVFDGARLGDSVELVTTKVAPHCKSLDRIVVDPPSFPLAASVEEHLICEHFSIYDGFIQLDEVSFTFADGALRLVEARGEAVRTVFSDNTLHDRYRIFAGPDIKVIETDTDSIWFLNLEGMHPNLYAWSNPYLPSNSAGHRRYESSASTPPVFAFGASRQELMAGLESECRFVSVQQFSPTSSQVNCFGIEYAGFPRKIEARFGDNGLELLWILTAKGEESRVAAALQAAYGEPIFESDEWSVFRNWEVSLRKDKPEVLVLSTEGARTHRERLTAEPTAAE